MKLKAGFATTSGFCLLDFDVFASSSSSRPVVSRRILIASPSSSSPLGELSAANGTRFSSLLDELTNITTTRFIIITHHALTMSRMHRLYGITMPEKGISQLVAVDLEKAEELVA